MAGPFKMKGMGFGNSPMKQDKSKKVQARATGPRFAGKKTDREIRISKNTEFNAYARKKGILPTFKSTEEMKKWYSNKANVNILNKKQAEYFKNK